MITQKQEESVATLLLPGVPFVDSGIAPVSVPIGARAYWLHVADAVGEAAKVLRL